MQRDADVTTQIGTYEVARITAVNRTGEPSKSGQTDIAISWATHQHVLLLLWDQEAIAPSTV